MMVQLTRFSNHRSDKRGKEQQGAVVFLPKGAWSGLVHLRLHSDVLRPLETRLISSGRPSSTGQDDADYKLDPQMHLDQTQLCSLESLFLLGTPEKTKY